MRSRPTKSDSLAGRRVAVTGAGGFLGQLLVQTLIQQQSHVLALDVEAKQIFETAKAPRLKVQQVDLNYLGVLEECLTDFQPDTLYHLASAPDQQESFAQVQLSIRNNLQLTANVLEAFHCSGGQLFVFGDSSKSYGDAHEPFHSKLRDEPLSSYAIAKSAGWQLCKLYARLHDVHVVSVRPTLVYGPTQRHNLITYVIDSVLSGKEVIPIDGGEQTRDPLYCDDAIEAFLEIARRGCALSGKVINIGGGREISVKQLAEYILKILDRPNVRIETNASQKRPTESARNYCENHEVWELLGWKPEISLEMGLQKTISQLLATSQGL